MLITLGVIALLANKMLNSQIGCTKSLHFLWLNKLEIFSPQIFCSKNISIHMIILRTIILNGRRGGGVVANTLDYQSRDSKIVPRLLQSFRCDFKPRSLLRMTSLLI